MARIIEERVSMVRLFSEYENAQELQRHYFNTSPPALPMMTAVNRRFNKTGSIEDLPHTDRPETV